jgi:hypothetical protein
MHYNIIDSSLVIMVYIYIYIYIYINSWYASYVHYQINIGVPST